MKPFTSRSTVSRLFLLCTLLSISLTSCNFNKEDPPLKEVERMTQFTTSKKYPSKFADEDLKEWQRNVPEIKSVKIKSTIDGKKEGALFYASSTKRKKPLLVMLHSWSSEYLQEVSIPFALWSKEYDWAFIHPNFRGAFETPEAMASDLAVQDIIDAVNYAKENANIDESRIYILGSSGGAMTALVTAGRHPEIWAGVVAWVPVYDIPDWFEFNLYYPHRMYNSQIVCALGSEPLPSTPAAEEARRRSPSTYIQNLKGVPLYLAHGITDLLVPPDHSIRAFNELAEPKDTISQEQIDYIVKEQTLPPGMESTDASPYFGEGDPKVVFIRESANVRLVLFEGVHDMAYNPGLLWLNEQRKQLLEPPQPIPGQLRQQPQQPVQ